MGRILAISLLVLSGTFFLTAMPSQAAPDPSLSRGIGLYRSGDADAALLHLRSFVVGNFGSPELPEAYLYLARIFRDRGQAEEALLSLRRIPEGERSPTALLLEGATLVELGQSEEGLALLRALEGEEFSEKDRRLRFSSLGRGLADRGEPLKALLFLYRGLAGTTDQGRVALLEEAHDILREKLSDAELGEAAFMFDSSPLGQDALLQSALRAYSRGERQEALRLVESVAKNPLFFPYRREAMHLLDRLSGSSWLLRSIGVALPLSGRYQAFGELVRRGMELAAELHDPPARLVFADTGADPQLAAQAVSRLANEERVMAIAGPLTGASASAAAFRAQQEGVPLLTLSQRDGLAEIGDYVFRNSLTSRLQIKMLVRYAIEEVGMSTFGVLYPENRLGAEMVDLFIAEVEAYGAEVTDIQEYAEDANDFGRQIKLLKGEDPDAPEEEEPLLMTEEEEVEDLFVPEEPIVQFEALFIPDYGDRIGIIAPQLAFYGIEEIPLLGINGWNSPELLRLAGKYVEGAVFVDGFFPRSSYPFVQEFVNLYSGKYGEEPSILEAQGFDVVGILLGALGTPLVATREELRRTLAEMRNYPGVTGATSFGEGGDAEKILFLLQVQNGKVVQIN